MMANKKKLSTLRKLISIKSGTKERFGLILFPYYYKKQSRKLNLSKMHFGANELQKMKKNIYWIIPFIVVLLSVSCKTQKEKLEFITPDDGKRVTKGETLDIKLKFPFSDIDSVVYSLDGEVVERKTDTSGITIQTENIHYGSRNLRAKMYGNEKEKIAYSTIKILPPKAKEDRKSTRLNSSHVSISYAVFCLKQKIKTRYKK